MTEEETLKAAEAIDEIDVEETEAGTEETESGWSEEFVVAGEELVGFVKKLVKETTVRRLVIKNESHHIHLEIPLVIGVAGIALMPVYAALGVIAALVTDCTILVERADEKEVDSD